MFGNIAKIAYSLQRSHSTLAGWHGMPAWDALTTKERNVHIAAAEHICDAVVAGKTAEGDALFIEAVKWLVPLFRKLDDALKREADLAKQMELEQTGALLYIAAMVKRFGGETGIVALSKADMEAALEVELSRHDDSEGGLVLRVTGAPAPEKDPAQLDLSLPPGG